MLAFWNTCLEDELQLKWVFMPAIFPDALKCCFVSDRLGHVFTVAPSVLR